MLTESFHFDRGKPIPPDAILGISQRYELDPRPHKIDAGVGVFRMERDKKYVPNAVRVASRQVTIDSWPGGYLSPKGEREWPGEEAFLRGTAEIVFGPLAHNLLDNYQVAAVGTCGGTGALAVYAESLKMRNPDDCILISKPTWGPHIGIFQARGIQLADYNHVTNHTYDLEAHLEAIKKSPANTRVLFHTGRTHNPTGVNPANDEQWRMLAQAMEEKTALFDTAYAGFVDGLEEDTKPIRIFMEEGVSVAVAFSYSKNAGLYEHRVGALLIPLSTASREQTIELQRLLNISLRVLDSSPAAYGEGIMSKIFSTPVLRAEWVNNLAGAAAALRERREILARLISDFNFVKDQYGLFSPLPLSPKQVQALEKEEALYMAPDGRANLGGVPNEDIERFVQSIQRVI